MLYKKVGFPLNVRNNPSPADTVILDKDDDDDEEREAIISEPSIHRVVSSSQSFVQDTPASSGKSYYVMF